jgi:hypothetical protein
MVYDSVRIKRLENKMKLAGARQNGLEYSLICEDLGVEPDDRPLYDLGLAERKSLSKLIVKNPEILDKKARLELFYKKGLNFNSDFGRDTLEKREWLNNFFNNPKRRESLEKMEDISVGAQFHNILKYIRRQLYPN